MACPSAANRETATSLSPLARLGSGGHGAAISQALPVATACRSTAITSARSSSSASRVELRHLPDNKVEMNRVRLAYRHSAKALLRIEERAHIRILTGHL